MKVKIEKLLPIIKIRDYKTGKDKSSGKYAQTFDQLLYYAAWYFEKFPVDTIIIEYDFVEHIHNPHQKVLTRDNLNEYKKFLLKNILEIEKCVEWDKNVTPLCSWCQYEDHCNTDSPLLNNIEDSIEDNIIDNIEDNIEDNIIDIDIDEDELPF